MTENPEPIARQLFHEARERIVREFREKGFLPATQQLMLRQDPSFGWSRRLQTFRTTPHLRAALLAVWPAHLLLPARRPRTGRLAALDPGALLGGDGNTFYFNALIAECLEMFRAGEPPSPAEAGMERSMAAEYEDDWLEYQAEGGRTKVWGYFPLKHHRFDPKKPLLRLLFAWGANAADLDSTSVVLCRLLKSGSRLADPAAILSLLEDHVHGEGRHGRERLVFDNGAAAEDRGILLWVGEKHNELDAGVNLNLACLLAAMLPRLDDAGRARAFRLSAGVFRFLGDHVRRGSYASKPFLMYYSLEAMAFLWMRLDWYLESLPAEDRERFDPRGDGPLLGAHLADLLQRELQTGARGFNPFDRFLVLPLLLRSGRKVPTEWLDPATLAEGIREVSAIPYEFGKFVYPTTLLYGSRALGLCAAAASLRELMRPGTLAEAAGPAASPPGAA